MLVEFQCLSVRNCFILIVVVVFVFMLSVCLFGVIFIKMDVVFMSLLILVLMKFMLIMDFVDLVNWVVFVQGIGLVCFGQFLIFVVVVVVFYVVVFIMCLNLGMVFFGLLGVIEGNILLFIVVDGQGVVYSVVILDVFLKIVVGIGVGFFCVDVLVVYLDVIGLIFNFGYFDNQWIVCGNLGWIIFGLMFGFDD